MEDVIAHDGSDLNQEQRIILLQTYWTLESEVEFSGLDNSKLNFVRESKQDFETEDLRKAKALEAYWTGKGVVVHQHITHAAGSYFCRLSKKQASTTSSHACHPDNMRVIKNKLNSKELILEDDFLYDNNVNWISIELPWTPYMPYTSERLTYVTVFRDPITRAFSPDGFFSVYFPLANKGIYNPETWKGYQHSTFSDNFNMRHLLGKKPNTPITRKDLEDAKGLLRRFTFVLIMEWFEAGYKMYCEALLWHDCNLGPHRKRQPRAGYDTVRELVMNDTIYTDIVERNQFDIELYHYAIELNLRQMRRYGQDLSFLSDIVPTLVLSSSVGDFDTFGWRDYLNHHY